MARKPVPAQKRPTPEQITAAIQRLDFATAGDLARKLYAAEPTPEHLKLLRQTLLIAARYHADRNYLPQFQRVFAEYSALPGTTPDPAAAAVLVAAGQLDQALAYVAPLNDPTLTAKLIAHAADRAIRRREKAGLPPELHAGFDAVLAAFDKYEAGDDEAARAALEPVGVRSPFLEWKLLLRGLSAYTANDDARAIENWQRLSADRIPSQLAAPVRVQIDSAFRTSLSPDVANRIQNQASALASGAAVPPLEKLRSELSRDKPLVNAFKLAEAAVPALRQFNPDLPAALGRCFYRAIIQHGEPADMAKYRRVFGAPVDDPDFYRLEAMVFDSDKNYTAANEFWAKYADWLANGANGWPADLARRAQAIVFHKMGHNLVQEAEFDDEDEDDEDDFFGTFFGGPRRRTSTPRKPKTPPDPSPFFQKSAELAPDWPEPASQLVEHLVKTGKLAKAQTAAKQLLERVPTAVASMEPLAAALMQAGKPAESLAIRTKVLAANPLDKTSRVMAGYSYLAVARKAMIDGELDAAEAILEEGREVCTAETPTGYRTLQSSLARKQKRTEDADRLREEALATPGGRLAALLFLSVDSLLAKLKTAERKPHDQALAEAFKSPVTPREVSLLYGAWDQYAMEGIEYRGQKTHEKKIQAMLAPTAQADAPEFDFEILAQSLATRNEWKACEKLASLLRRRFPKNPVFPLLFAEYEFFKADDAPPPYRVMSSLLEAKRLAEASPEPRHKKLIERIDELMKQSGPPPLFDFFNRHGRF